MAKKLSREQLETLRIIYPGLVYDEINEISNLSRGRIKALRALFDNVNDGVNQTVCNLDLAIDAKVQAIADVCPNTRSAIPFVLDVLGDIQNAASTSIIDDSTAVSAMADVLRSLPVVPAHSGSAARRGAVKILDMAKDFLDAAVGDNPAALVPAVGTYAQDGDAVKLARRLVDQGVVLDMDHIVARPLAGTNQHCVMFKNAVSPEKSVVVGENGRAMTLADSIDLMRTNLAALERFDPRC